MHNKFRYARQIFKTAQMYHSITNPRESSNALTNKNMAAWHGKTTPATEQRLLGRTIPPQ